MRNIPKKKSCTSLICFFILISGSDSSLIIQNLGIRGIFAALLSGILGTFFYSRIKCFFSKKGYRRKVNGERADLDFRNAMQMIAPAVCVVVAFCLADILIVFFFGFVNFQQMLMTGINAIFDHLGNGFIGGAAYVLITGLMWFFGIYCGGTVDDVNSSLFGYVMKDNTVASAVNISTDSMTPLLGLPADVFAKTHQGGQQSQSEENGNIVSNGTNFGPGGNNFRPGINNNDQNNGDDEIDNDNDFDNDSDIDDNGNDNDQEGELSINEDPESAVYAIGNYAEDLTVGLSGDSSSATFQWYKSDNEDSDGTAISGATDDTLDGEEISTESAGSCYYYCVVEDGDGNTLTSDNAEITVKELAITTQPKSGTYKQGKNVKLSVAFIGNGDVQWYSSTDNSTWK